MDNFPQFSLKGKTAVVTGGAGILGTHFCETLKSAGARVVCLDMTKNPNTDLSIECDISKEDSVQAAVSEIIKKMGHIDILVNNAASKSSSLDRFFDAFEDYSLQTWKEVMSVNIDGMFLLAKHVGKHMKENKIKGSIIQIASVYGVVAPDQRIYEGSEYKGRAINSPAVYSASKAAVIGLSQYLATYWGENGIRVNTITPGGVSSGQNNKFSEKYSARVPMGRMATEKDMQGALLYLASEASGYVTGHNLIVDGGLTAW